MPLLLALCLTAQTVSAPNVTVMGLHPFQYPISIQGLSTEGDPFQGESVIAAEGTIYFNPSILKVVDASIGSAAAGWLFAYNARTPGQIRFAMAGTEPMRNGTLLNITFKPLSGGDSYVSISNLILNNGNPQAKVRSGNILVIGLKVLK